jgi:hypothetical protein
MLQVKDWVLIAGVVVTCLGYECLPHGQSVSPPNNLSFFTQSADAGVFKSFGFLILLSGLLLIIVGLIVPRKP